MQTLICASLIWRLRVFNLQVASVSFGYNTVNPAYSGLVPSGSAAWDVTTGTLVIDLRDNKTDRIVFRGTAKDVLQRAPSADAAADAKLVSKPINKGIAKIFKKYPVAGKVEIHWLLPVKTNSYSSIATSIQSA